MRSDVRDIVKPLGMNNAALTEVQSQGTEDQAKKLANMKALKQKQAMTMATAPGSNLLMTGFMLWMSGNTINLFSMMFTGMALFNPLKAIFTVNSTFEKLNDGQVDLLLPKLIYCALQLLALGIALYKCGTMGLLPITSADWTSYLPIKEFTEFSAAPV